MLVSAFITILRRYANDIPVLTRDLWDGDGATLAFRTKHNPIVNTDYSLYVGSTLQTETTDYTLDKDSGLIEFVSAPAAGSDNVSFTYYYANLSDTGWIDVINNVIRDWKEKIWVDAIDETAFTTVANQDDYDMDTIDTKIFAVLGVWLSSGTTYWADASSETNVRYFKEQNILNFRPAFDSSGYTMRIRYLKSYAEISAVTDTFTIPERYHSAFQHACAAEYLDRFTMKMINDSGAKVKEETYKTLETIARMADRNRLIAREKLGKVRPIMPATSIQTIMYGVKS
jgi:hypothetical protein